MTTMTTAGGIIFLLLILAVFLAGIGIGFFYTKRKAEAIMRTKGWISDAEDSFRQTWKKIKRKF